MLLGGIEKMSKSKNNVVEPRKVVERYGADTARFFSMFAGPPEQSAVYSESGVEGAYRFVRRLWAYCHAHRAGAARSAQPRQTDGFAAAADKALRRQIHLSLQQADFDFKRLQYNTVVSAGMKMLNALEAAGRRRAGGACCAGAALREALGILLRVLYPIVPHVTHVLWNELGYGERLRRAPERAWPSVDAARARAGHAEIVVQVNGKLRGHVSIAASADEAAARTSAALADEHVRKFVGDKPPRKVIYRARQTVEPGRMRRHLHAVVLVSVARRRGGCGFHLQGHQRAARAAACRATCRRPTSRATSCRSCARSC